jgi:hypothetical protein
MRHPTCVDLKESIPIFQVPDSDMFTEIVKVVTGPGALGTRSEDMPRICKDITQCVIGAPSILASWHCIIDAAALAAA